MRKKNIVNGYWREKWNYSPNFIGDVSEETKKDFLVAQVMNMHDVSSLDWTSFEEKIIRAVIKAGNNLLKVNGFKQIKIFDRQIIVLDDEVYKEKVKMSENEGGNCSFGYVFVRRNKDRGHFIIDIAHEISHLFSFYSLSVKEEKKERFINSNKLGFSLLDREREEKFLYFGLNEAATDLWSKAILREVERMGIFSNLLSEEEKTVTFYGFAYGLHVHLIEEIFLNRDEKFVWPFLKSYFDGSDDFLNLIKKDMPEVLPIIKNMDNTVESVIQAAYEIGGDKLRDKILNQDKIKP